MKVIDLFEQSNLRVIQIRFDGGCRPNPGQKYGSYEIIKVKEKYVIARATRFQLGFGTCNEAELESLILALEKLMQWVSDNSYNPTVWKIKVLTDSTLVCGHLMKPSNPIKQINPHNMSKVIKARRRDAMIERALKCKAILRRFGAFNVEWRRREENVEVFGH